MRGSGNLEEFLVPGSVAFAKASSDMYSVSRPFPGHHEQHIVFDVVGGVPVYNKSMRLHIVVTARK